MKNSEAVQFVENSLGDAGIGVLNVGGINTGEFKQGDHPDVAAGIYKVVQITVMIRDED